MSYRDSQRNSRMHSNLRSFLNLLRRENDLASIDSEVDPYLEIAEIHRRVIARGGPALLFTRVKGSRFPVVTNLFGTQKRIELAFGSKHEAFVKELVSVDEASLTAAFEEVGGSDALGVILAARGPVFSAGHDFADMAGADLGQMRALLFA